MDPKTAQARAAEARRLLAMPPEERASYRDLPPEVGARRHLLDVLAILAPGEPLGLEELDDFRVLWAWVCRCADIVWETWEPGEPPTGEFDELVRDGRPDMADGSEELAWLGEEVTDPWVVIGHGHDGHRFLFWDTSAGEMTVYEVDNSDPEVVTRSWVGVEGVLRGVVIESALRSLDFRAPRKPVALSRREELQTIGGCLLALAVVVALVWWLVHGPSA